MRLLNHIEEVQQTLPHLRPQKSGPEVQQALFLVWHAANRVCAKRLIPFLPTLIEPLERHEHLTSPGRYHPLQIRTLRRGMLKIRTHLLETLEEQWQDEVIYG